MISPLYSSHVILINFDFFSHGSGDYFDVDSYSGVVDYENIPSYTSDTTGTKFELRDVLDFRPRVDDASTIDSGNNDRSFDGTGASTVDIPEFGSDITSDFENICGSVDPDNSIIVWSYRGVGATTSGVNNKLLIYNFSFLLEPREFERLFLFFLFSFLWNPKIPLLTKKDRRDHTKVLKQLKAGE